MVRRPPSPKQNDRDVRDLRCRAATGVGRVGRLDLSEPFQQTYVPSPLSPPPFPPMAEVETATMPDISKARATTLDGRI